MRMLQYYRLKRFITIENTILIIIIDVRGIKIELRSFSMRMSPGNFPNQLNKPGEKCKIAPITNKTVPTIIIHFAIRNPEKEIASPNHTLLSSNWVIPLLT